MARSLPVRDRARPVAARAWIALGVAVLLATPALANASPPTLPGVPNGKHRQAPDWIGKPGPDTLPRAPQVEKPGKLIVRPGKGLPGSRKGLPDKGYDKPRKKDSGQGSNSVQSPSSGGRNPAGSGDASAATPAQTPAASTPTTVAQPPAAVSPLPARPPGTRRPRRVASPRRRRATRTRRSTPPLPRRARGLAASVLSPLAAAGAADLAGAAGSDGQPSGRRGGGEGGGSPVGRTVGDIVEVVPGSVKVALAALVLLSAILGAGSLLSAGRTRRLASQRGDLLKEVGLLQSALLPPVPDTLGSVRTSVAYSPAEGLAAGGDFYDALALPGDRAAFILGDVSGHGQKALDRTAFVRYTLRAYVEAGLEPRSALRVAGRVVGEHLGGDFVTVVIAVHDPMTGSLTYAAAGHPAPIVVGAEPFEPVLAASSPPIGIGVPTGQRQTSLPFPAGAIACLYTDGLTEARTADGGILGRGRLGDIVGELGPGASARGLLERVAEEASTVGDDMATCLFVPTVDAVAQRPRVEELEVSAADVGGPMLGKFLHACGLDDAGVEAAESAVLEATERYGGALLRVVLDGDPEVEVFPRDAESILAASRRVAAG